MIEFKCSYCGAAMSAPAGRLGESEACPSCGLTTIVETPGPLVVTPEAREEEAAFGTLSTVAVANCVAGGLLIVSGVITLSVAGRQKIAWPAGQICGTILIVGGVIVIAIGSVVQAISHLGFSGSTTGKPP